MPYLIFYYNGWLNQEKNDDLVILMSYSSHLAMIILEAGEQDIKQAHVFHLFFPPSLLYRAVRI